MAHGSSQQKVILTEGSEKGPAPPASDEERKQHLSEFRKALAECTDGGEITPVVDMVRALGSRGPDFIKKNSSPLSLKNSAKSSVVSCQSSK